MSVRAATETGPPLLRVALVEDHVLFAEALDVALSAQECEVCRVPAPQEGGSVTSLAAAVLRHAPDLVLLDLDLGRFGDGSRLIEPLVAGGARVVVLTGSLDERRWGGCLAAGAVLVMVKSRPLTDVLDAVRRIRDGLPVLDGAEHDRLVTRWRHEQPRGEEDRNRLALLTGREAEVLGELMAGHNVLDIARARVVSEGTVRAQVRSILAKLEVSSQVAAVGAAYRGGWAPWR